MTLDGKSAAYLSSVSETALCTTPITPLAVSPVSVLSFVIFNNSSLSERAARLLSEMHN